MQSSRALGIDISITKRILTRSVPWLRFIDVFSLASRCG